MLKSKKSKKTKIPKKTASFEENLEELNEIVENLEDREYPLKESLNKFQKGMNLINQCHKELETAELEISTIMKKDGKIVESPVEE